MNDLNSVFIVGKVVGKPKVSESKVKELRLEIENHHYSFDEEKKEYAEENSNFAIIVYGRQAEKWGEQLKAGARVGVNGRMSKDGIVAYAIQILEAAPAKK